MNLNPLRAIRDFSRTRRAKVELLAAVKLARPGGIDLPRDDDALAVAVMAILADKDCQHLTVVKTKKNLTLAYRDDVNATISLELQSKLAKDHFFATPGEDLTNGR